MRKWITLAFLCLAFFFYMSDRQLFGLLVPLICEDTGLNKVQIGLIDSALYWVLALGLLPFRCGHDSGGTCVHGGLLA